MSASFSEHDLLYGLLAVQMGLIDREQLILSVRHWTTESSNLGHCLLERCALTKEAKELLDALVDEHLARHDHDAIKSLATLSSIGSLGEELKALGNPDVNATLGHLPGTSTRTNDQGAPTHSSSTTGSEANRFRILRQHAKGGIGQVSVAVDDELSREVALKELQSRYADDQAVRARFVLEAEVTGGLEHPGVVPVYGLGHYADGRPYYAMRFVRGGSLQEAAVSFHQRFAGDASEGSYDLELRKLLRRFIDVCDAIEYAHSRGVLHRDLKPGNVMLGRYGETLVVDWGLAKISKTASGMAATSNESTLQPASADDSAPTQMGSAVGTPNYMSPEQAAGQVDDLGVTSDVYSLGATLYHVLTGQPPFQGNDIGKILAAVQMGCVEPPRTHQKKVPKPLDAICVKAMSLKPQDRYPTARALADDIERWLADDPIAAMRDTKWQSIQRWTRRHRGLTLASAIGLAAIAVISGVAYVTVSSQRNEARTQRDRAIASENEAQQNFQAAEKARKEAVEQELRAERVAYNSTLSEVSQLVGSDPMMAKSLLENELRSPLRQRDIFWGLMMQQVAREERAIVMGDLKSFSLCYSPDGASLATGSANSGEVVLWNSLTGKRIADFEMGLRSIHEIVFSPDGKKLAAIHYGDLPDSEEYTRIGALEIEIWDVVGQQRLVARTIAFPSSGVLSATDAGFFVDAFDSEFEYAQEHPEYGRTYQPHTNADGRMIDRWLQWRRYDVLADEVSTQILKLPEDIEGAEEFSVNGNLLSGKLKTPQEDYQWLYNLEQGTSKTFPIHGLASGSTCLLVGQNSDAAIFLGMAILEVTMPAIDSLADVFLIDFVMDVSCHLVELDDPDKQRILSLGQMLSGSQIEERERYAAVDRPGNKLAVLLDRRPIIQLFDLQRPAVVHHIPAHLGDVVCVALSPDGTQLASLGLDRTLRFWNVPQLLTGREPVTPAVERPRRLLLTPDGDHVIVLGLGPEQAVNEFGEYALPESSDGQPAVPTYFQSERYRLDDLASTGATDHRDPPIWVPVRNIADTSNGMREFANLPRAFSGAFGDAMSDMFAIPPIRSEDAQAKLTTDGSQLLLCGPDRLLRFDMSTGESEELWGPFYPDLQEPVPLQRIVVSEDLNLFATLTVDGRTISVYDFVTKEQLWQQSQLEHEVSEIKFIPASNKLLVVKKSEPVEGSLDHVFCEIHDVLERSIRPLGDPLTDDVEHWSLSEDGAKLAVYKHFDRQALVLDVATGQIVSRVFLVNQKPAGFLPRSELLVLLGDRGDVKFWDSRLNQYRATIRVFKEEAVRQIVLSHDDRTLIALGEHGSLRCFGTDRLIDDLADVSALMHVAPRLPDEPPASEAPDDKHSREPLPQIEILDDVSQLPQPSNQSTNPIEGPPIPPAAPADNAAPIPPQPVADPDA